MYKLLSTLILCIVCNVANGAAAFEASEQRGLDETQSYAQGKYDSISTMNGNLSIAVPIGRPYEFPSGMKYAFTLTYNANAWDSFVGDGWDAPFHPSRVALSIPMGDSNVGLGWKLSFGEIYPPSNGSGLVTNDQLVNGDVPLGHSYYWVYAEADGSRHQFYPLLHPDATAGLQDGALYTSDGTFLRMRVINTQKRVVDFPDGTHHIFECAEPQVRNCWHLTRMEDQYVRQDVADSGNWVEIHYPDSLHPAAPITINDSLGRQHAINRQLLVNPYSGVKSVVSSIDIAAPSANPNAPAARAARYTFSTDERSLKRGCTTGIRRAYQMQVQGGVSAVLSQSVTVPILTKVGLPNGANFVFEPNDDSSMDGPGCPTNGRLASMTDPMGKVTQWDYAAITYNDRTCPSGATPGPQPPISWMQAVAEKREYASAPSVGQAPNSRWRYTYETSFESIDPAFQSGSTSTQVCPYQSRQLATSVHDSQDLVTVYYSNLYSEDNAWSSLTLPPSDRGGHLHIPGWTNAEYGLPFSRYRSKQVAGAAAFINSEVFQCPQDYAPDMSHHNPAESIDKDIDVPYYVKDCTRLRQTFVTYDHDGTAVRMPAPGTTPPSDEPADWTCTSVNGNAAIQCADTNRRARLTQTVYSDDGDRFITSANENWDGYGHFRTTTTTGNIASSPTSKTTNYNFGRSADAVPTPSEPWLLNLYDMVKKDGGGQVSRTDYCFDTDTGFLRRTRQYWDFGNQAKTRDVVTHFVPVSSTATGDDVFNGQLKYVRFFGGDNPVFGITFSGCGNEVIKKAVPEYAQALEYQNGKVSQNSWVHFLNRKADPELVFVKSKSVIDQASGYPLRSTDQAGITKKFWYDEMGRLVKVESPGLPTIVASHCYASIPECRQKNLSSSSAASSDSTVSEVQREFDGFGRVSTERQKRPLGDPGSPDVVLVERKNFYDAMGNLVEQTPWLAESVDVNHPGAHQGDPRNTLFAYDLFGRRVETDLPDGSVQTTTYTGVRKTTSRSTVAAGTGSAEEPVDVIRFYDELGRIVQLQDQANGGDNETTTTSYGYDANGTLDHVESVGKDAQGREITQIRSTIHDALGNVREYGVPEYGVSITSTGYSYRGKAINDKIDSLGNVYQASFVAYPGNRVVRSIYSKYDTASRLIQAYDGDPLLGGRLTKETFYAADNAGQDLKRGKIVSVKQHNYVQRDPADSSSTVEDWIVRENYHYKNPAGLLTSVSVRSARLGEEKYVAGGVGFDMSQTFLASGELFRTDYPTCDAMGCAADQAVQRSVGRDYTYGAARSIYQIDGSSHRRFADFTYLGDGALHRVSHYDPSGLLTATDTIDDDTSGITRPAAITVASRSHGSTQLNDRWTTGPIAYDGSGNIKGMGGDRYTYDKVGRIRAAMVDGKSQSIAYDAFGNIVSMVTGADVRSLPVDPYTNRLSSVGQYEFDVFGNMINWQGRKMVYDSADRLSAEFWDEAGAHVGKSFIYAPSGARIATIDASGSVPAEKWTMRDPTGNTIREFARNADGSINWSRDYVVAAHRTVASVEAVAAGTEQQRNFHVDQLGSTRLVTDTDGSVLAQFSYFPFGEIASASGSQPDRDNRLYTGHERDVNSASAVDDLDYMKARFYAPSYGRFLSIDPLAIGDTSSSQSWNRYSYVMNSPLIHSDPTGMACSRQVGGMHDPSRSRASQAAGSCGNQRLMPQGQIRASKPYEVAISKIREFLKLDQKMSETTTNGEFLSKGVAALTFVLSAGASGIVPVTEALDAAAAEALGANSNPLIVGSRYVAPNGTLTEALETTGTAHSEELQTAFEEGVRQAGGNGHPLQLSVGGELTASETAHYINGALEAGREPIIEFVPRP